MIVDGWWFAVTLHEPAFFFKLFVLNWGIAD